MIGRLYAGGAPLDVAAALLAMRDGVLPPTINLDEPAEGCDLDFVTGKKRTRQARAGARERARLRRLQQRHGARTRLGLTLDALLRESALRHADRPALAWGDERLSYRELDEAVDALAAHIGPVHGRPVALIAPNTPALVVGLFAIWRLGATAVPLNARLREHELRQILADAEPAALVSVSAHQGYSFRRARGAPPARASEPPRLPVRRSERRRRGAT